MQKGCFYCYVPRSPAVPNWLLPKSKSEKVVHKKLDEVLSRNASDGDSSSSSGGGSPGSHTTGKQPAPKYADPEFLLTQPQTYVFPGGGVTLRPAVYQVAASISRVQPYVHTENGSVIVFYGYLSNLNELLKHVVDASSKIDTNVVEGVASPKSQRYATGSQPNRDTGTLTASVILHLYTDNIEGNELILLSELQGQYAFVIYDSNGRQVFAARDPSGSEDLYYQLDSEGALSFTNSPSNALTSGSAADWMEVPPGHYFLGRSPKLQQFALTPEQLYERELHASDANHFDDLCDSITSSGNLSRKSSDRTWSLDARLRSLFDISA